MYVFVDVLINVICIPLVIKRSLSFPQGTTFGSVAVLGVGGWIDTDSWGSVASPNATESHATDPQGSVSWESVALLTNKRYVYKWESVAEAGVGGGGRHRPRGVGVK